VAYLLINPPSDLIRQTIVEQVKTRTGRDLIIAGPASFTFYPGLGVSLGDVSLSGQDGTGAPLVTMQALDISVQTIPLLSRQIAVERLRLVKPVFDLKVDKQGRKNWDFASASPALRYAQANPAGSANDATVAPVERQSPSAGTRLARLQDLELSDVQISDGIVRYSDERSGTQQDISGLNLKASMPSLNKALKARGDVLHGGQKVAFDATLTSAAEILAEKPAKLLFRARNALADARFDGTIVVKQGADFDGKIEVESPSARNAAAWLGTTLPPVAGFGPLSINGTLRTAGNVTRLSNATFILDGTRANGTIIATTGGVRPMLQADLKIAELDLNQYLTPAAGGALAIETAPAHAPSPGPQPQAEPDEIEKLLNAPGTKVYGAAQRAGWSSEAFNLALLSVADATAKLETGRLKVRNIIIDQAAVNVGLKNRAMNANFERFALYKGRGTGVINIDGSSGTAAAISANFNLDGVAAQTFLKDAAGVDWLAGNARVAINMTANGASQLQLIESLNGKANFNFTDGAIVGFNLAGAIRNISQGNFSGLKKAPTEKTDFSEMTASFDIANGIARNQDLLLIGPLLRVTGQGAINLPPQTIDYTAKPKIVASLQGQSGNNALSGLEIPVRITGPWSNPRYEPDFKGVLSNPDQAIETVKEIGKQLKGKKGSEILDNLLGDSGAEGADTKTKAKDLLNRFLKKD
jgi:AsmA protein